VPVCLLRRVPRSIAASTTRVVHHGHARGVREAVGEGVDVGQIRSSGICATNSTFTSAMPNIEDFKDDFKGFNNAVIDEFRSNGGQVTGMFAGAPLVLLTTTGAKSGKTRTTPIVYTTDGDNVVIIASKGGAPTSPDWFHNLVANPEVKVELANETFDAKARVAEEPERERLYRAQAALMPNFDEYQKATTRKIPVVVLERV
jgi:deazaflavin-dependent oxidoreductase (nitroreductase family)